MTKRRASVAAGAAAALALSACGATEQVVAPATTTVSGSITIAGCPPFKPLIPSNTVETCGSTVLDAVTAKLMTYERSSGRARNDLAQSVRTTDAKKFTITLRADAKYSDGSPVRAADFVKAWNYAAHGPNRQLNQYLFSPIAGFGKVAGPKARSKTMKGLKVRDARTFTVTLSRPASTFVQRLGLLAYAPLPPSFFADKGAAFKRTPIGAGPYRVVSGNATSGWVLRANPGYNGPTPPSVEQVTVKMYTDPMRAYDDVMADRVDLVDDLYGLPANLMRDELGARALRVPRAILQTLVFPPATADSTYRNAKLRRALALAIDRVTIGRQIYGGELIPATGWAAAGAYGRGSKDCGSACGFDPTEARALYKAAGGHSGPIKIAYNADADHKTWVGAACRSITKTLGVVCKGVPVSDFGTFRARIDAGKQPGLIRAGWQADYPSVENFLTDLYRTGGSANDGDYSSEKFDALLAKAAATPDLARANALYRKAEALLRSDMPAIPLWTIPGLGARSMRIASAGFTVFGTYDLTAIQLA